MLLMHSLDSLALNSFSFLMLESLCWCIYSIYNAGESFWHIQSMSSLVCKALHIVVDFIALLFICLSSVFVYFKNGSNHLKRETFSFFWVTCFIFPSPPLVWWYLVPIFPSTFNNPSLLALYRVNYPVVPFLQLFLFFSLFIMGMTYFSMQNSIPITSCIFILVVSGHEVLFFFHF